MHKNCSYFWKRQGEVQVSECGGIIVDVIDNDPDLNPDYGVALISDVCVEGQHFTED